jgi:hypothetical protein
MNASITASNEKELCSFRRKIPVSNEAERNILATSRVEKHSRIHISEDSSRKEAAKTNALLLTDLTIDFRCCKSAIPRELRGPSRSDRE